MDNRQARDLDNWITGHYGEDQFRDDCPDNPVNETTQENEMDHTPPCKDGCTGFLYGEETIKCECPCHNATQEAGKTNYTPGPWHTCLCVGHKPEGDWPGSIQAENGQVIYAGPFSFRALRGATPEEAEANARLIATAPEMFAFIQSLEDEYAEARQLIAAIKAAKG